MAITARVALQNLKSVAEAYRATAQEHRALEESIAVLWALVEKSEIKNEKKTMIREVKKDA